MPQRISAKRLLATALPLSFVWAFAACVTLCSENRVVDRAAHAIGPMAEMYGCDEADCCPITGTPVSLLPERFSPRGQVSSSQPVLPPMSAQLPRDLVYTDTYTRIPAQSSGPPSTRLRVLRI